MHRLFAAILPPEPVAQALVGAMGGVEGAHWQTAAQLHLTLAFVGPVDRHAANELAQSLENVSAAPITLTISEPGLFETARGGRAGTLFARIRAEGLDDLAARVRQACRRAGTPADNRRFVPHITLARMGARGVPLDGVRRFMETPLPAAQWQADRFWLVESHMGRSGSHYQPIADYPLG